MTIKSKLRPCCLEHYCLSAQSKRRIRASIPTITTRLVVSPFRHHQQQDTKFFSTSSAATSALSSSRPMAISTKRSVPKDGLTLADFVGASTAPEHGNDSGSSSNTPPPFHQYQQQLSPSASTSTTLFHLKTYGCQMNVSDSDIVRSLLVEAGMTEVEVEADAHVVLTNTCAIREKAEDKIWNRLAFLKSANSKRNKSRRRRNTTNSTSASTTSCSTAAHPQVVGVLGCMAERLKERLLDNGMADLVVGPDAYRDLPHLIHTLLQTDNEVDTAVNVQLSVEETYADVKPVRGNNVVSAFVSVMRGCNNMCSYCVVPFTRGRERSRPLESIASEIQHLLDQPQGEDEDDAQPLKEVVLLGQNVNSYHDKSEAAVAMAQQEPRGHRRRRRQQHYQTSNDGFTNLYRLRGGAGYYFADLVEQVSDLSPELRVRFTSPHPKDYPPELLQLMAERPNVCNQLHMPAQSGSSSVLQRMRRGYTREAYLELMDAVHSQIPDVAITSDFIAGFCGETQQEHEETLSLMEQVQYDQAFMFAYSMREKTLAHRQLLDNVSEEVKLLRLQEIIHVFRTQVQQKNEEREVGRLRLVLVEGESKKSKPEVITWHGRTDQNKRVVFPMTSDLSCYQDEHARDMLRQLRVGGGGVARMMTGQGGSRPLKHGDYAVVQVTEARGHTLRGRLLWRTTLSSFNEMNLSLADEDMLKGAFVPLERSDPMLAESIISA